MKTRKILRVKLGQLIMRAGWRLIRNACPDAEHDYHKMAAVQSRLLAVKHGVNHPFVTLGETICDRPVGVGERIVTKNTLYSYLYVPLSSLQNPPR